jgi:hypothetical protein
MSTYQTAISATSENQPLTPLSAWMVTFEQQMGQYMNTADSLTAETFASFQAAALYNTAESEGPDGTGYHTFN